MSFVFYIYSGQYLVNNQTHLVACGMIVLRKPLLQPRDFCLRIETYSHPWLGNHKRLWCIAMAVVVVVVVVAVAAIVGFVNQIKFLTLLLLLLHYPRQQRSLCHRGGSAKSNMKIHLVTDGKERRRRMRRELKREVVKGGNQ